MPPPPPSPDVRDLLHERLDALLDECNQVMDAAAYGQTIHDLDDFMLIAGKKLLQEVMQQKLQERIEQAEQKPENKQCPQLFLPVLREYQNNKTKTVGSAHGPLTLCRQYRYCIRCETYSHPVEVTLGLDKSYTNGLNRLVSRCCGLWSYRMATDNLQELCGIHLSHTTVGEIAADTADTIAARMESRSEEIRNAFQQAKGEGEFYADGTFIHIRNDNDKAEWREMKVGAFAKRERGEPATPSEWNTRKLPEPNVVSAFAAIADKGEFQEMCQSMRRRLGVGGVSSALGDGAKWIWNVVWEVFGKTEECLDVYHRERLASGRVIGSGLIEGACKNLVGRRLKQTGACWRLPRANRIAGLCAVLYSGQWKDCWKKSN